MGPKRIVTRPFVRLNRPFYTRMYLALLLTTQLITDRKGNSCALGICCCNLVLSFVLRWYLGVLNGRKEKSQYTDEANRQRQKSFEELGDYHPGKVERPSPYNIY